MGIKKNFAYNVVLTMTSYIVSFIVFPHVSRVLGVSLLGRIAFANNVINYFSLFALLGVSAVGIREIASCGNDRYKRSKVFSSILAFILLLTFLSILVLFGCIFFIDKFWDYRDLLFIGSITLFFTSFLIEWFYQGIEQFKYISIRTIIVRCIYAISVFVFVRSKDDYLVYYLLTASVVILNSLINISYSKKYVDISFKGVSIFKYAKEIVSIGAFKILTSMYTTFNVVFLGFVASDQQVGFYSTATKLFYILLGILSAFTGVMLPRMSSLLSENKKEEFNSKIQYSFELVFMTAIPIIIWVVYYTPQIIRIIAGAGFEGAIAPMRIIMPMLFITGLSQIVVVQTLIPLKKDKIILIGSVIGATVGVISNILLAKRFGATGTAIILLISELAVFVFNFSYVLHNQLIVFPWDRLFKYIIWSIPYLIICLCISFIDSFSSISLFISAALFLVYFIVINSVIIKNTVFINFLKTIKL